MFQDAIRRKLASLGTVLIHQMMPNEWVASGVTKL
jgi:hypothetical protein